MLGAAYKQGVLGPAGYAALIASTTQLNRLGGELGGETGVHAVTDVTGFGLLGHALEMARGSGLDAVIDPAALAWLPGVETFAEAGVVTGASGRNWASYGDAVFGAADLALWRRDLLCDPQTSGGLLIAVAPDRAEALQALALSRGFAATRAVGRMEPGVGRVRVTSADAHP